MSLPALSVRAILLAVAVTYLVGIAIMGCTLLAMWALDSSSMNLDKLLSDFFLPFFISYLSLATIVQFTACGYVAARFSKTDEIQNALVAAVVSNTLSTILGSLSFTEYWGIVSASFVLSIGSAWFGCYLWVRAKARRADV